MSEANAIYDEVGNLIATAKFGVAWSRVTRERLGEYHDGESGSVYDNNRNLVGSFSRTGEVRNVRGDYVGRLEDRDGKRDLYIGSRRVGQCVGKSGVGAAALLLLFSTPPRL
jgi:hypothetical protein